MNENLKKLEGELQGLVAQLQAQVAERGDAAQADALAKEHYAKLNERIDGLQDQIKAALRTRSGDPVGTDPERQKADAETHAAVLKYLRRGEQRLSPEERTRLEGLQKALSVDSDPDGGYLVTPAQSSRISTIVYETSPMRQLATVETITTDAIEGTYDGDQAEAGWVSERGARSETTTPQVGQWRIPVHEMYANPRATQKLLDDSGVDVEAWLNRKVADRFARLENTAFVSGDGVGKPRGFTTYPDGSTRGKIARIASGDASTITPEGIINTIYALKSAYRQGAAWVMNRATVGVIRTIRDESGGAGTGQFFWAPGFGGQPSTLAGYPITEFEDMDNVSGGNIVAGFGNFRTAYTIVDRIGIRVLRDPFTAKPYVQFYTTKRVGGDVINFEAIKLMDIAAS